MDLVGMLRLALLVAKQKCFSRNTKNKFSFLECQKQVTSQYDAFEEGLVGILTFYFPTRFTLLANAMACVFAPRVSFLALYFPTPPVAPISIHCARLLCPFFTSIRCAETGAPNNEAVKKLHQEYKQFIAPLEQKVGEGKEETIERRWGEREGGVSERKR
jgi:hypothetical protein